MPKIPQNSQAATKADIAILENDLGILKTDVRVLKTDVKGLDKKLDRLQNTLYGFVGVVDDLRTENIVGTNQISELRKQVKGHEKRIVRLESHNN